MEIRSKIIYLGRELNILYLWATKIKLQLTPDFWIPDWQASCSVPNRPIEISSGIGKLLWIYNIDKNMIRKYDLEK